jgi:hypothetical protein
VRYVAGVQNVDLLVRLLAQILFVKLLAESLIKAVRLFAQIRLLVACIQKGMFEPLQLQIDLLVFGVHCDELSLFPLGLLFDDQFCFNFLISLQKLHYIILFIY